jgi:aspartate kinase
MKVFKFGGASLESVDRIKQVTNILCDYKNGPLLLVASAIGKTTNELENVAEHYFLRKREIAAQLLYNVEHRHLDMAEALLEDSHHPVFGQLRQFFTHVEWLLGEKPYLSFDYYYDQIVSLGELLSSAILSAYLQQHDLPAYWLDVRDIIRTDDNYRDGNIDWEQTQHNVTGKVLPLLEQHNLIITQGFIGGTAEKTVTTLGREGSDYTAAVFANMLDAESLTIWKDVEGLKNADPKLFSNTVNIAAVSYNEVIEMAYYGAQVIHPKTIKPLQNKKIPLYVKCFLDKDLPGTVINGVADSKDLPPIIVLKKNQVLITVTAKDFSFITEDKISDLYELFHSLNIRINLTQNAAISFSCCIDNNVDKIEKLIKSLHQGFTLSYHEGLQLLTIRHYQPGLVAELTGGKTILLEQRSPLVIELVIKG